MAEDLGKLEGKPVRSTSLSVAGINKVVGVLMSAGPRALRSGEKLCLVLEVEVGDLEFSPTLEETAWNRGHKAHATRAAFIATAEVGEHLATYGEALAADQDAKKGRMQLSPEVVKAGQIAVDHRAGKHNRRRRDCPECYPLKAPAAKKAPGAKKVGGAKRGRS